MPIANDPPDPTPAIPDSDETGDSSPLTRLQRRIDELEKLSSEHLSLEKTLQESEACLKAILESTGDGIIVFDDEGLIIHHNSRFLVMWRIPAELAESRQGRDLEAMMIAQLEDPASFRREVERLNRTSEKNLEMIRFKDGRVFAWFSFPFVRNGTISGRVWNFRDVTDRKQKEQLQAAVFRISETVHATRSLDELSRQVHAIVSGLLPAKNFYIALYDPDLDLISFPYFVDEFDPPPQPRKLGLTLTGHLIRTGQPMLVSPRVFEKLVKKGKVRNVGTPSVDWLGVPLKTAKNKIIGALVVQTYTEGVRYTKNDLSILTFVSNQVGLVIERKRAEEALAREKERLTTTLGSIGDGVIATDTEGRITLINKVAEDLTGWKRDAALGRPLNDVFRIFNDQTRETAPNPVGMVLQEKKIVGIANNTVLIAHDGNERIISDSGAPIWNNEGEVSGVVLVFRDITERLKMEQELSKIQKLESIGVLAGGIAHDFNNILTAIIGNISLARMHARVDGGTIPDLLNAEKAAKQAQDLTQQLLTFARGGAPVKETASIEGLVQESVHFALRGSDVDCNFSFSGDLLPVNIDKNQISQVIQNIIINADQAMPDGGIIEVSSRNVTLTEKDALPLAAGDYIKLSIRDHGVGISSDHLKKIFDPYFTTKKKGSGLGLAIAFSIIKNHDGFIDVHSDLGQGSVFDVYLPADRQEAGRIENRDETPVPGKGRILIMDDEELVREAATNMLEFLGYQSQVAGDGKEALDIYRRALGQSPFTAIIMDLTIPGGMGGKEASKKVLEIDPHARIIVSSGYSHDPIMADYRAHGFRGVIRKPYNLNELSKVLADVIAGPDPAAAES